MERIRAVYGPELARCRLCSLFKEAQKAVPGTGNELAEIMLIGEAPGREEDRVGKPFVGRSGKVLDRALLAAGLNREMVYITNIIKHRPPNYRRPYNKEIRACSQYIDWEISSIGPKYILTLGSTALRYFLPEVKMRDVAGHVFKWQKIDIVPTYHPAAVLRNPKLEEKLLEAMVLVASLALHKSSSS